MLKHDIRLLEDVFDPNTVASADILAWGRIKKFVEEAQKTPANIDYTAAILDEFHKCRSEGVFRKPYFDLREMAVRLNSAIKDSQNCA